MLIKRIMFISDFKEDIDDVNINYIIDINYIVDKGYMEILSFMTVTSLEHICA